MSLEETRLKDFNDRKEIGQGGFGTVYSATWNYKGKNLTVALKQIKDGGDPRRLINEERALSMGLNYSVEYYGSFKEDGSTYLVMEYCQFGSLRNYVKKNGPLNDEQTSYVMSQLVIIIRDLHGRKILHRDISAGNVLIRNIGSRNKPTIRLCDFGLVGFLDKGEKNAHTFAGTPGYMDAKGMRNGNYGTEVDAYSLGGLLFFLLTGIEPPKDITDRLLRSVSEDAKDLIEQLRHPDATRRIESLGKINLHRFMRTGKPSRENSLEQRSQQSSNFQRNGFPEWRSRSRDHARNDIGGTQELRSSHDRVRKEERSEERGRYGRERGRLRQYSRQTDSGILTGNSNNEPSKQRPQFSREMRSDGVGRANREYEDSNKENRNRYHSGSRPPDSRGTSIGFADGNTNEEVTNRLPRNQYSNGARPLRATDPDRPQQRIPEYIQWPMRLVRTGKREILNENGRFTCVSDQLFVCETKAKNPEVVDFVVRVRLLSGQSSSQEVAFSSYNGQERFPGAKDPLVEIKDHSPVFHSYEKLNENQKEMYRVACVGLWKIKDKIEEVIYKNPPAFPNGEARLYMNGKLKMVVNESGGRTTYIKNSGSNDVSTLHVFLDGSKEKQQNRLPPGPTYDDFMKMCKAMVHLQLTLNPGCDFPITVTCRTSLPDPPNGQGQIVKSNSRPPTRQSENSAALPRSTRRDPSSARQNREPHSDSQRNNENQAYLESKNSQNSDMPSRIGRYPDSPWKQCEWVPGNNENQADPEYRNRDMPSHADRPRDPPSIRQRALSSSSRDNVSQAQTDYKFQKSTTTGRLALIWKDGRKLRITSDANIYEFTENGERKGSRFHKEEYDQCPPNARPLLKLLRMREQQQQQQEQGTAK